MKGSYHSLLLHTHPHTPRIRILKILGESIKRGCLGRGVFLFGLVFMACQDFGCLPPPPFQHTLSKIMLRVRFLVVFICYKDMNKTLFCCEDIGFILVVLLYSDSKPILSIYLFTPVFKVVGLVFFKQDLCTRVNMFLNTVEVL